MFQVLIVDDEPAASDYIKQIIEKKCDGFHVCAIAENGMAALEQIKTMKPDIVITDIKMPVMDGLELVKEIHKSDEGIISVVISGFQEFEYAQEALRANVCEYLLKPVKPSALKELFLKLECKLNKALYEKRIKILKELCNNTYRHESKIGDYFPLGKYYTLIVRTKGLPRRFLGQSGMEIYSMQEEQVYLYGRDENEALYLIPSKLLPEGYFDTYIHKVIKGYQGTDSYVTCVKYMNHFDIEQFPEIVKQMYRKLDQSIVIGKNQIVSCGLDSEKEETGYSVESDKKHMKKIEYLIRNKKCDTLALQLHQLFQIWKSHNCVQIYIENKVTYIFQMLCDTFNNSEFLTEVIFTMDEAFSYVSALEELEEVMLQLIEHMIPVKKQERLDDKEALLQDILMYLNNHLEEGITLMGICKTFGISQTALSRMFRRELQYSFGNYLTRIRIDKAKEMMRYHPDIYIKEVALGVGYNDQFYFSRIFRSVEGICPSEYMERHIADVQGKEEQ